MELEVMKKLIRKYEPGHTRFSLRAMQAERYYRNETDILVKVKSEDEKKKEDSYLSVIRKMPLAYLNQLIACLALKMSI